MLSSFFGAETRAVRTIIRSASSVRQTKETQCGLSMAEFN